MGRRKAIKIRELTAEEFEKEEDEDFLKWLNSPWPDINIDNETEIDEFLWHYLLLFRDMTERGARLGYYMASRNRAVAEAKIALLELMKTAPPVSNVGGE